MRAWFALLLLPACAVEPALLPESEGPRTDRSSKALLGGGTVISRPVAGDEPGETELYFQPAPTSREAARVIFPAPGADDRPTLLPDGRLLFVSTRTTIASLWIGDLATGELTQLTNRGLAAGKSREGMTFTPPPHGPITFADRKTIEYDAGGGRTVRVAIAGGAK